MNSEKPNEENENKKNIVYDESWKDFYLDTLTKAIPAHEDTHRITVCMLENYMPEESSLLSAGIGTGLEAIMVCSMKPNWSVTGFDPSKEMIKIAEDRMSALRIESRVHLFCGFAEDMSDYIKHEGAISFYVYHYLKTKEERVNFLKNIRRLLKPKAPFALICGVGKYGEDPWVTQLYSAFFGYSAHKGLGKKKELEKQMLAKAIPNSAFLSENDIMEEFQEAGFTKPQKYLQILMACGYLAFNQ